MDDNVVPFRRVFRRKRRFQGATWTPNTSTATVQDGLWCPVHRIRHGYMSTALDVQYEKGSDGNWKTLWVCKLTGNVLEEVNLGAVRIPEGGRREDREDGIWSDWFRDGNGEDSGSDQA